MSEVAEDSRLIWHTVTNAVVLFGQVLTGDPARFAMVTAVGLDETLTSVKAPTGASVDPRRSSTWNAGSCSMSLPGARSTRCAPGSLQPSGVV